MVGGKRAIHPDPQQFVLLVIQPLFATTVVAVEQATVADQLRRCQRFPVLLQIGRAGAGHFMPGQQRPGDQPFIVGHRRAYCQIKTVPRQVTIIVVQIQLDLYLRVLPGKLQQQTIEEGFTQGNRNGHTHRPCHIVLEPRQCLTRAVDLDYQCLGLG